MTAQLILAFIIAFLVSSLVGRYLVPYLRRIKDESENFVIHRRSRKKS